VLPQTQAPPALQRLARVVLQAVQVEPDAPQADVDGDAVQVPVTPPAQQPEQEVLLHWHWPLTHCWPTAQATPEPQAQVPLELQLSEVATAPMLQPTHTEPPLPHWVVEREAPVRQVPPAVAVQQPLGQELPLHWQVAAPPVPTHCWPATQAGPLPQLHTPLALHRLARVALQAPHWPPLEPHCEVVCDANGTQVLPEQQPLGQAEPLQLQVAEAPLPVHDWPGTQAEPVPHLQVPLVVSQVLEVVASQGAQRTPPAPHWLVVWFA
jgi:hypothetical protein